MNDQSVDYENWVPKNILWILLGITLILVAGSFFPVLFFVQIILRVISVFILICLMLTIYSSRMAMSCSIIYSMLWLTNYHGMEKELFIYSPSWLLSKLKKD